MPVLVIDKPIEEYVKTFEYKLWRFKRLFNSRFKIFAYNEFIKFDNCISKLRKVAEVAAKSEKMIPKKKFRLVGVYNNGARKYYNIPADMIMNDVDYDIQMRWGRALFVDGQCLYTGYLDVPRCLKIQEELKKELEELNKK